VTPGLGVRDISCLCIVLALISVLPLVLALPFSFLSSCTKCPIAPQTTKMSPPRVLLIGGHGKISMLLTPLLLERSWNVTSVIRNPNQTAEIEALGKGLEGKVDVVIESLDDVKSDQEAQRVLDQVKPDYVVWSAGKVLDLSQLEL
jgi:hypothetical protein